MLEKFAQSPGLGPAYIHRSSASVPIWAMLSGSMQKGGLRILNWCWRQRIGSRVHRSRPSHRGKNTLVFIGGVAVQSHANGGGDGRRNRHEVSPRKAGARAEDAVYDRVGNIMLERIMGADLELVDEGFDIGIRDSSERRSRMSKRKGAGPTAFRRGGSVHKYGGLGWPLLRKCARRSASSASPLTM